MKTDAEFDQMMAEGWRKLAALNASWQCPRCFSGAMMDVSGHQQCIECKYVAPCCSGEPEDPLSDQQILDMVSKCEPVAPDRFVD